MSNVELLVIKAIESADFRGKLIANPEAAAQEAGVSLPTGASLVVHEDSFNELNLVIGGPMGYLNDTIQQLLLKAQQDPTFKARLMKDPETTIRAESGIVLPPSLKVNVHENTETAVHIVLPVTEAPEGEMSDLELEAVAGGSFGIGKAMSAIGHLIGGNQTFKVNSILSKLPGSGDLKSSLGSLLNKK